MRAEESTAAPPKIGEAACSRLSLSVPISRDGAVASMTFTEARRRPPPEKCGSSPWLQSETADIRKSRLETVSCSDVAGVLVRRPMAERAAVGRASNS